jgi:hypothetical protein
MTEQNDFWLQLHKLGAAYKALGASPEIRATILVSQFQQKSPQAQNEASEEMLMMATALSNLYSRLGWKG